MKVVKSFRYKYNICNAGIFGNLGIEESSHFARSNVTREFDPTKSDVWITFKGFVVKVRVLITGDLLKTNWRDTAVNKLYEMSKVSNLLITGNLDDSISVNRFHTNFAVIKVAATSVKLGNIV